MARGNVIVGLVAVVAGLSLIGASPATGPTSAPVAKGSGPAAVIVVGREIDYYTRDALFKRFEEAKKRGARTIILKLNTPGGLADAAMEISRFLRRQDDVHTVAFVERMALSAGIMIGLSADELVMAPESLIGDSAPIAMTPGGGLQSLGETERAKAESPIHADFRASAEKNGYDPLLVGSMVTVGRVVHYVQAPDGRREFVEPEQYKELLGQGWKVVEGVPDPVDRADTLLTVNSSLAEKLGLSQGTFSSPEQFAAARGMQVIARLEPTGGEKFIAFLGSAIVRGILLVILMQSLYIAFTHPGHGAPEAVALISLGMLLGVPLLTGYASWWEITAIIAGLALIALEIFVIPGFGVAGIVGIALMFGGLVLTFVGGETTIPGVLPVLRGTWAALQQGLMIVTIGLACSLFLWVWLNRYLPKLPYFNRLILTSTSGTEESGVIDVVETGPAVGDVGVAVTDLRPGGSVKFITDSYPDGRIAAVVSDSGFVQSGTSVVVREVAGNRVVVRGIE